MAEAFPGFSGDGGEQRVDDESDDDSGAPPKTRGDALLETGDRHGVFASEPVPSQVQLPGSTLDTPVFDPRDHVVDDRIEADNVDGRRSSVVPVEKSSPLRSLRPNAYYYYLGVISDQTK